MLAIGAGRTPKSVALGRYWPERLLYFPVVLVLGLDATLATWADGRYES